MSFSLHTLGTKVSLNRPDLNLTSCWNGGVPPSSRTSNRDPQLSVGPRALSLTQVRRAPVWRRERRNLRTRKARAKDLPTCQKSNANHTRQRSPIFDILKRWWGGLLRTAAWIGGAIEAAMAWRHSLTFSSGRGGGGRGADSLPALFSSSGEMVAIFSFFFSFYFFFHFFMVLALLLGRLFPASSACVCRGNFSSVDSCMLFCSFFVWLFRLFNWIFFFFFFDVCIK